MYAPFLWFDLDGVLLYPSAETNHVMVNTLRYLRDFAGFGIGVLANEPCGWGQSRKQVMAELGGVDAVVDSRTADAGTSHRDLFRIAEREAGIPANISILVDRDAETCAAANASGWRSIQFHDNSRTCRELKCATGIQAIL
ncbi:hypothetical protein [Nocardia pseudobrasiliensis]|uniref:Uncharacterized protein n=1 Tax=Nocardia pseudobrasiliensis TaxID=45979 RepID=A0A370IEA1_9NOCA|nr:hypothetical protein [Nocardia pseudobrasiliensis]RDI69045.1 hypothetical protein DFR76_101583 [Nocardia pseudobrasiliensis]